MYVVYVRLQLHECVHIFQKQKSRFVFLFGDVTFKRGPVNGIHLILGHNE
jgi:hypothetical protein